MKIEGEVGPEVANDGSVVTVRLGKQGEQVVTELQPRYYLNAYRGNSFMAANVASQAVSVGLATTYTGLCLYNPAGSGVNLVLNKVTAAFPVAPAAALAVGIMVGYNASTNVTHTTPITRALSSSA